MLFESLIFDWVFMQQPILGTCAIPKMDVCATSEFGHFYSAWIQIIVQYPKWMFMQYLNLDICVMLKMDIFAISEVDNIKIWTFMQHL